MQDYFNLMIMKYLFLAVISPHTLINYLFRILDAHTVLTSIKIFSCTTTNHFAGIAIFRPINFI